MLAGDFAHKLLKLNRNFRFHCGEDGKPAGLYLKLDNGLVHVCGVDRNVVDKWTHYDAVGHIAHSGWLRVLKILVAQRLVDKQLAQRVFCADLSVREPYSPPAESEVTKAINAALARSAYRGENFIHRDDVPELAHMVRATHTDEMRAKQDRLRSWAKRVGIRRA